MKVLENKMNFEKTCRVCLAEEKNMRSLFSVEQILEKEIKLSDILMSCSSVRIEKNEGLPEKICFKCSEQANISYLFRKLCESSDTTLRELSKQYEGRIDSPTTELPLVQNNLSKENEIEDSLNRSCSPNNDFSELLSTVETEGENNELQDSVELPNIETDKENLKTDDYICNYCPNRFHSKEALSSHYKIEHSESNDIEIDIIKKANSPNTCSICKKKFRFHSNLERHKLTHTKERPYLCNVCGKTFNQSSALKIHHFSHTGEKPYNCQICMKNFSSPSTLLTHLRTHTGERPHVCKICGKQFLQAGYLSSHIRTHTGEKPNECSICGQGFNQSGKLTIHMRTHTGEKPYQCEICKKYFALRGTLKKHIRTHTGERPYKCNICGQSFAQNGTLSTHLKIHKPKLQE